jgi:4-diphosphocytidyl-2-C-methyl-D-erythritol kinase
MRDSAPAKLNLCLYVGGVRSDGLHEIASIFEPLRLADRLDFSFGGTEDLVKCEGVDGVNLADRAIAALRANAWAHPPIQVRILKRIPVAGGLGGGSADAGAVLRYAQPLAAGTLSAIAEDLGADVTSQIDPRPLLVGGAGERIEAIQPPAAHGIVLIPQETGLSAAEVYAEHDRLGPGRSSTELEEIQDKLRAATVAGESPLAYKDLLINDLEPAAVSLRPEVSEALDALRQAGAPVAMVSGSGPTAMGLFSDRAAAERAHGRIRSAFPASLVTEPQE